MRLYIAYIAAGRGSTGCCPRQRPGGELIAVEAGRLVDLAQRRRQAHVELPLIRPPAGVEKRAGPFIPPGHRAMADGLDDEQGRAAAPDRQQRPLKSLAIAPGQFIHRPAEDEARVPVCLEAASGDL